jgi:F-type H+-transporting ATPase subunit a
VGIDTVFPQILWQPFGIPITNTVVQTWLIVAALVGLALWASRRCSVWQPQRWQLAVEYLVEYVENQIVSQAGRAIPAIVPYLATMISFIAIANLAGLLPLLQAPTRDLNTTAALSLFSFLSTQYLGIRTRGVRGWLHSFIEPNAIMLPMNILGMLSRMLSMALRLFGNIVAGEIIAAVFFALVPLLSPLPMSLLSSLTAVLQALVFTVLTLVFTVEAMGPAEGSSVQIGQGQPSRS